MSETEDEEPVALAGGNGSALPPLKVAAPPAYKALRISDLETEIEPQSHKPTLPAVFSNRSDLPPFRRHANDEGDHVGSSAIFQSAPSATASDKAMISLTHVDTGRQLQTVSTPNSIASQGRKMAEGDAPESEEQADVGSQDESIGNVGTAKPPRPRRLSGSDMGKIDLRDGTVCFECHLKFASARSLGAHRRWKHSHRSQKPGRGRGRGRGRGSSRGKGKSRGRMTTATGYGSAAAAAVASMDNVGDVDPGHDTDMIFRQRMETLRTELRMVAQTITKKCLRDRLLKRPRMPSDYAGSPSGSSQAASTETRRSLHPLSEEFNVYVPSTEETLIRILIASACRTAVRAERKENTRKIMALYERKAAADRRIAELERQLGDEFVESKPR